MKAIAMAQEKLFSKIQSAIIAEEDVLVQVRKNNLPGGYVSVW